MSYFLNNQQKVNDIIFANRNKAYGAYAIRSSYGNTLAKSLSIMLAGVGALAIIAYLLNKGPVIDPNSAVGQLILHDSIYVIPFKTKEEEVLPKERSSSSASSQKTKSTETSKPVIIDSTTIDQSATVTKTVAALSNSDTPTGGNQNTFSQGTSSSSIGNTLPGNEVKADLEVDSMPQFEGGLKALYRFVSSNLRYPERAQDADREGVVFVRFVVDENGKVGNLNLLNTLGYGLDDEALRVVGLIPKFKSPAKVKGHPVKVYYQLPIRFRRGH